MQHAHAPLSKETTVPAEEEEDGKLLKPPLICLLRFNHYFFTIQLQTGQREYAIGVTNV